jgi:pyroglutamyl-peptidase
MAKTKKSSRKKAPKRRAASRPATIRLLLTGFGPFPGAPVNPTGPLIRALKRKLQSLPGIHVDTHVFRTTYAAVDRGLPRLLAKTKPHALLMFGLANRSRGLRVETQARNRISRHPDAAGIVPVSRRIADGAPKTMPLRAPKAALLHAAKSGALPARLSVNAGDYLCNYLYWRALEAAKHLGDPSRAVFVHVPLVDAQEKPGSTRTMDNLMVAAEAIADALISAAQPRR